MFRIEVETHILAPPERCFDLARDVDAHCKTADFTGERALPPGRTSGLLELGEEVTFEAVHLGVRQRLTARISAMDRPHRFTDDQVRGPFVWLRHVHSFTPSEDGTRMVDTVEGAAPLGWLGALADRFVIAPHFRRFLSRKQAALKRLAEGPQP